MNRKYSKISNDIICDKNGWEHVTENIILDREQKMRLKRVKFQNVAQEDKS